MTIIDLKQYIYENNKIELVLERLGCQKIQYHNSKDYFSATQPDSDNIIGIVISNNKHLNYRSYSRNIGIDENADLISLVEYNQNLSFIDAVKYLHKILGLDFK